MILHGHWVHSAKLWWGAPFWREAVRQSCFACRTYSHGSFANRRRSTTAGAELSTLTKIVLRTSRIVRPLAAVIATVVVGYSPYVVWTTRKELPASSRLCCPTYRGVGAPMAHPQIKFSRATGFVRRCRSHTPTDSVGHA